MKQVLVWLFLVLSALCAGRCLADNEVTSRQAHVIISGNRIEEITGFPLDYEVRIPKYAKLYTHTVILQHARPLFRSPYTDVIIILRPETADRVRSELSALNGQTLMMPEGRSKVAGKPLLKQLNGGGWIYSEYIAIKNSYVHLECSSDICPTSKEMASNEDPILTQTFQEIGKLYQLKPGAPIFTIEIAIIPKANHK